jgi:aminoglycoside phosphotransferase (APT) family kinase protein
LRLLLSAPRLRARSRAAAVVVHSHIRCFYPWDPPLTLWLGSGPRGPAAAGESVVAGLAARSRFGASEGVRVPRLVAEDLRAEPPWALEEMVRGRPFGAEDDWSVAQRTLIPALFQFYDAQGVDRIPAARAYERDRIAGAVETLVARYGGAVRGFDAARFGQEVERQLCFRDESVPAVLGHGDLSPNNLMVDVDGNIVIIDWTGCRRLPLALELVKLLWQRPQYWEPLARGVEGRTGEPLVMPARRQFFLAALYKLAGLATWEVPDSHRKTGAIQRRRRRKVLSRLAFAFRLVSDASGFPKVGIE